MNPYRYGMMFRLACKSLKYYFLALCGFTLICVVGTILGAVEAVIALLPIAFEWLMRLGMVNSCLMAIAVVVESLRH